MINCYIIDNGVIASGPHVLKSTAIKTHLSTGNPECLTQEELANGGVYPEYREPVDPTLGWADPVLEPDNQRVAIYASGTPEEREAASLAQRKALMQSERAAERTVRQTNGFSYNGYTYASDREESIPLLTAAAIAAQSALAEGPEAAAEFGAGMGAGWRSADGIPRLTTATEIVELHAAFVSHGAACDVRSQQIKAEIEAATTPADLDAIDMTTGWPA